MIKHLYVTFSAGIITIMVELYQHLYWCISLSFAKRRSKYNKQGSISSPYRATQHKTYMIALYLILFEF